MMRKWRLSTLPALFLCVQLAATAAASPPVVRHQLEVRLDPTAGTLEARDRLTWPDDRAQWLVLLHEGLQPRVVAGAAELTALGRQGHLAAWRLQLRQPGPVTLAYGGRIRHDLDARVEGMGRERQTSPGTIAPEGIVLNGASGWYPRVPETLQSFCLAVRLPDGWHSVSQGTDQAPCAVDAYQPAAADTPDRSTAAEPDRRPVSDSASGVADAHPTSDGASGTAGARPTSDSASGVAGVRPASDGASGAAGARPASDSASGVAGVRPASDGASGAASDAPDPEARLQTWTETRPQEDIHLIAAPFTLYRSALVTPERTRGDGSDARPPAEREARVYLRRPDPALAERYLDATRRHLAFYERLLGPYPYAKFALVENFWETGYGMPSFTLLGPQVIRLPFIPETSYPHEILHNWWGNGVYPDPEDGNWTEGLTTYLADHLLRERAGTGAAYRRELLKRHTDHVHDQADFPLREFRARHGEASQSIGYGKGALFFHMLRRELGDAVFIRGLRDFYGEHRFGVAGFDDLRRSVERAGGVDLADFFRAWTARAGTPRLELTAVESRRDGSDYLVRGRLAQTQDAPPFPLRVPLLLDLEGAEPARLEVALEGRAARFEFRTAAPPLRLRVDPGYDLFRELLPGEQPVTLSTLFGAERGLILIPADAPPRIQAAWRQLAANWSRGHPGWESLDDDRLTELPAERPVWLLGWENRWLPEFAREARNAFALDPAARRLDLDPAIDPAAPIDAARLGLVLTQSAGGRALGWIGAPDPTAIATLARRIPHYGKESYLVFGGPDTSNRLKGQWPAGDSALTHWFVAPRPLPPSAEPPALDADAWP